jgi:hypothetical protein
MRRLSIAIVGIAATAGAADANRWRDAAERLQAGALAHYELTGLTAFDDRMAPPKAKELVLAGARAHAFVGTNASVAYLLSLDFSLGSTIRSAGFAYDVSLLPVGIAVRWSDTAVFGVATGVGFSGAVGALDDAVTAPLEAITEFGTGRARVMARARASYVAGADSRQSAAPSIPFADEFEAMLGLRVGRFYDDYGFPTGNGYFLGASYRELANARYIGLTFGYSLDMATPRRWISDGVGDDAGRPRRRRHHRHRSE